MKEFYRFYRLMIVITLAVFLSTVDSVQAQTAKLYVGAVGSSQTVFRYEVGISGSPTLDLTLTHASFAGPGFMAFSPAGEMFVMSFVGVGGVSRFLDPEGTPVFNGTIASSASSPFSGPHWGSFRGDELFIANQGAGNVLRFTFDAAGNAVPNGAITGLAAVRAVQENPATGELFVTICCGVNQNTIRRYLIDASGNAVPNGSITGGGMSSPHDLAFSPWGELFVVNGGSPSISRFVFDAAGNASSNGVITEGSLSVPLGVDFSPWGELFVANRNNGVIHRWVFDTTFQAVFNGSFQNPAGIHDLQFVTAQVVDIDIKPGSESDPNSINLRSKGSIAVAFLTTTEFDATDVDPSTVEFGPAGAPIAHSAAHLEDVDGDSDLDLLLHFKAEETGIACGDTEASLTGLTFGGTHVEGSDSIKTVDCR